MWCCSLKIAVIIDLYIFILSVALESIVAPAAAGAGSLRPDMLHACTVPSNKNGRFNRPTPVALGVTRGV